MKVKVKRSGAVFIGVTVFLGVAAANTGNNLLYMIVSSMLALMLVSGTSSILNLKGLRLKLIPPSEVFANRRAKFRIVLYKEKFFPSFLIRVSSESDEVLLPIVDRSLREEFLELRFPKRGVHRKVRLTLSSDFPLGMFIRQTDIEVDTELIVFPEPVPTDIPKAGKSFKEEGQSELPSKTKGYEELRSIKPYGGEPMKLIHWKLSAKKDELMVKELLQEEKEPVVLRFESIKGSVEEKLSKLAYLTIKLIDMGYPVGLVIGDKEIPPRRGNKQKLLILEELALY